jgi:hypothetical protein
LVFFLYSRQSPYTVNASLRAITGPPQISHDFFACGVC